MNIDLIRLTAPVRAFLIHMVNESVASSLHLSVFELLQTIQVTQVTRQILHPRTRTQRNEVEKLAPRVPEPEPSADE